jgi:hypothetical protein
MKKSEPIGLFAGMDTPASQHPDVAQMPVARVEPRADHIPDAGKMVQPMPPAPHNGTETSRAAAMSLDPEWLATQCGEVYEAIKAAGEDGKTRHELVTDKRGLASVCGRVDNLLKMGLIYEPAGVTRPTKSGRQAQVVRAR